MVKCKDGPYVDFEQHQEIVAALAAENANLKAIQWETLKERNNAEAENERLRKAGDDLANEIQHPQARDYHPLVADWLAAKEGRDAK